MSARSAGTEDHRTLILVADDDPDIRELVAGHLERRGYSVVAAGDGEAALRLARERLPQVAVLDVGMPGLDGLSVAGRLLEAAGDEVGVIFLTARVQDDDVARGYDAGARAYIKKPFSLRELTEAVERVLGERALRLRADENRALAREQAALARLATAVAGGAEPEVVCALVAREVAELVGASEVAIVRAPGRVAPPPEALSVPVRVGDRVWGALVVRPASGDAAGADGVRRLERFADLVGLCLFRAQRHDELVTRATVDHLTGLPNARAFHERLEAEIRRSRRDGTAMSLVLIDVDHFKQVNDGHGHEVGDLVLAEVARRLAAVARTGEMVARIGGEEFAWILPGAEARGAFAAAERGRSAIAGRPIEPVGRVTVSAGVCELGPGADAAAELFRGADSALYEAKARGRDRCVGAAS